MGRGIELVAVLICVNSNVRFGFSLGCKYTQVV